jgi:hypothetical protein
MPVFTLHNHDKRSTCLQQLALSKVVHIFFELAKKSELGQAISNTLANLPPSHVHFARQKAWHFIMSKYNLLGPAIKIIEKAHSLNKRLSFFHNSNKP